MEHNSKVSHSAEIKEFVAALAKAQGSMKPAVFNKINPHYKNKYADFSSCMDACRIPLSENGLAPIQYVETIEGKLYLITMIAHISGQWMKSEFPIVATKMDSQGIGSAMTYAKRYSLCGMIGIVADEDVSNDDDGETAVGRGKSVDNIKSKMNSNQIGILKKLESRLDETCKLKITNWLNSSYKTTEISELPFDSFRVVLGAYENALKFMESEKKELAHV